ncbi:MAG TPA: FCD domain-containing protein [Gammaproteobacteria bacterium]|nr:FCD domain-containing protein [Gammaproteobacteria bacterium]
MSNDRRVQTLSDQAYSRLKHDIVAGALSPGTRLAVKQISDSYAIGASPIREALHRLAGEGLVIALGQRGFRVPPINLADLWDVTNTRVLLETEALRQSIRSGDDGWEAGVVAAYHQLEKTEQSADKDFAEWEKRNQHFHEALVAGCPSRWLQRLRDILHDQHRRYRYLSIRSAPARDVAGEHRALRDAALARDLAAAAEVLRSHIERTAYTVERVLDPASRTASPLASADRG